MDKSAKKYISKLAAVLLAIMIICTMFGCGQSQVTLDYSDENIFEADLDAGKNLVGKTVRFTVSEIHPQSLYGYNICSGEHLNFVAAENPNVEVGETITVKVTDVISVLGSWVIWYEKTNAVPDKNTLYFKWYENRSYRHQSPQSQQLQQQEAQSLELVDSGVYIEPLDEYDDTVYLWYCGVIHNSNESFTATYPKVIATLSNPDGTIIATDSQTGNNVMPGDTVTLVGMMSIPIGQLTLLTEETQWEIQVICTDFASAGVDKTPRTTDFEISNITEQTGKQSFVTGTVTNLTAYVVDSVNLSIIMRKDGEIVYIKDTFLTDLLPGNPRAFQFDQYSSWPEHDDIEISAQAW